MKIVTHNGHFHADDLLAVSALLLLHPEAQVVRSRDEEVINSGDIAVDVGQIYDPIKLRFDHHQKSGAGERPNGIPYASFGLIWKAYGEKLCGSKEAMKILDDKLVAPVDAIDNGIDLYTTIYPGVREYSLGDYFETFNYGVDSMEGFDKGFEEALVLAKEFLAREIRSAQDTVEDWEKVKVIYAGSPNKSLIVLPHNIHWQEILCPSEALYTVFPRPDGRWAVRAVPKERGGFELKKPLPSSWSGLTQEVLSDVTEVKDAVFCHRDGFIAVAETQEGAVKLAEIALNS